MRTEISNSVKEFDSQWDTLCSSVYQKRLFLFHAEKHNPCNQKYYLGYNDDNQLVSGAVVYSSKVNVLTFSKYCINLPMTIIGLPASVDASGMVGESQCYSDLVREVLNNERGVVLCLNYESDFYFNSIVQMETLPSLVSDHLFLTWETYLESLRHNYRRRIIKAEQRFKNIKKTKSLCNQFSREHYELYLNILKRTKTKIETLSFSFFEQLPKEYMLHSFYIGKKLVTWHITTFDKGIYYFLFGGINYELRDKYDAYYNNLIQIIKGAILLKSKTINLGQTAEISKNRMGARFIRKKMFLYHKNLLIRSIFRLAKNFLSYKIKAIEVNIYKKKLQS